MKEFFLAKVIMVRESCKTGVNHMHIDVTEGKLSQLKIHLKVTGLMLLD